MGAVLTIVGIIAAVLLGGYNPFPLETANQNQQSGQPDFSAIEACKPKINKNRQIQVQVKNELDPIYTSNTANPEKFNKTNKNYVLVKENATIPAWKTSLEVRGYRFGNTNLPFAEMEHIGTAQSLSGDKSNPDIGKNVYLGIGWCDPASGTAFGAGVPNSCLDPLVQDTIFVVFREGAKDYSTDKIIDCLGEIRPSEYDDWFGVGKKPWTLCHRWGEEAETLNDPPHNEENLNRYWWSFNVYYDASKLPADPQFEDLPCWMRNLAENCPGAGDIDGQNRLDANALPNCEAGNVLGITDDKRPSLIIDRKQMNVAPPSGIALAEHYLSLGKLNTPPDDLIIGSAYADHFHVRLRRGAITSGASADHLLILDPKLSGHDGPYWTFVPILGTAKPLANSLQLGTFHPGIPSFFYEWWTPSCKPALYFYPEKETEISVKVIPDGHITESIPEHGQEGWRIKAYPDGRIFQLTTRLAVGQADNRQPTTLYPYLYYEASIKNVSVSKTNGWIITYENLPKFFAYILPKLGLNDNEQQDFRTYWLPKLAEGEKWYITLIDPSEIDRVEKLSISPKPDNIIRVRFYFEKIDDNEIKQFDNLSREAGSGFARDLFRISDLGFRISKPRSGFVVVDWGGIIANGTCGMEETSQ